MPTHDVLDRFIAAVESNRHDEAIAHFYSDDASMQENLGPIRKGRDVLLAREREFMKSLAEIRSKCVRPAFLAGDHVVIRWNFEFVRPDGSSWTMDELAYQRWYGDEIAEERFYYDPAQRA